MDIFKNEIRDHVVAAYETGREELKNVFQFILKRGCSSFYCLR